MNFKLFSDSGNSVLSPRDEKQRLLLIILSAVLLVTLVIFYFGFWRSPAPSLTDTEIFDMGAVSVMTDEAPEAVIKKIDFDADFLESSYFGTLKVYGEWPLRTDEKGRANPFLPY